MSNSTVFRLLSALCLAISLLLMTGGCAGPDEEQLRAERERKMHQQVEEANRFLDSGAVDEAILLLETARSEYPDQPTVLEALGFAYLSANQHDVAADLFSEICRIDRERGDIAMFAARAFRESGEIDSAIEHYRLYLRHYPEDDQAWRAMADLLLQQNRRRDALDALLEALKYSDGGPTAADCLQISSLFLSLGNPSQAASWLDRASQLPLDHATRAELKLQQFELALRNQQWQQAAEIMKELDADYRAEFEASPHFANRAPLEEWIADQVRIQNLRITPASEAGESIPPATGEEPAQSDTSDTGETIVAAVESTVGTEPSTPQETAFSKIPPDEPVIEPDPTPVVVIPPQPDPEPTSEPSRSGVIGEADRARDEGNYDRALSLYMRAIGMNDRDATPWLEISRIYRIRGFHEDAELTALEAIRRAPDDPEMTINYLEILEKAASPARQLSELRAARERFPTNPDVTYAVARGFERLENNPRNAVFLYREFLATAPADHPHRASAESALQRLRR